MTTVTLSPNDLRDAYGALLDEIEKIEKDQMELAEQQYFLSERQKTLALKSGILYNSLYKLSMGIKL
jgi:hypothetical protein